MSDSASMNSPEVPFRHLQHRRLEGVVLEPGSHVLRGSSERVREMVPSLRVIRSRLTRDADDERETLVAVRGGPHDDEGSLDLLDDPKRVLEKEGESQQEAGVKSRRPPGSRGRAERSSASLRRYE